MFDVHSFRAHCETILPTLFSLVKAVDYRRERLELPDGDFIDLDWAEVGGTEAFVICHGLESNSKAHYIQRLVHALNAEGIDVIAMNFRGCSGEPNRLIRSYHSGETDDLRQVIAHILEKQKYDALGLIGFSLGGNVILKYLGEEGERAPVNGAVAISVPCDLGASARKLAKGFNRVYMQRFLRQLFQKIQSKNVLLNAGFDEALFKQMRTFEEFDGHYTGPVHGFKSAEDYWGRCSSKQFIESICRPTLLINAQNDPFLTPECYPISEARSNKNVFLETPQHGGHVGFSELNVRGFTHYYEFDTLKFTKKWSN